MNKKLITAASIALAACVAIGGTIAYLWDDTKTVTNTFSVGAVDIKLTEDGKEEGKNYDVIPGQNISKDPIVTLEKIASDSYLFVKVEDSLAGLEWAKADGWEWLDTEKTVLYREVSTGDRGTEYHIIKDATVVVPNTVTNEAELGALSFTAYAIQKQKDDENVFTPQEAWTAVQQAVAAE